MTRPEDACAGKMDQASHTPPAWPFPGVDVQPQAEAFVRGLWEVIDPQWLQMFSEPELQVLISGSNKTLDVEDLKRHTRQGFSFNTGRWLMCCGAAGTYPSNTSLSCLLCF